jgi:hypothetical protein
MQKLVAAVYVVLVWLLGLLGIGLRGCRICCSGVAIRVIRNRVRITRMIRVIRL